jgi:hypothetical protein
MLNFEASKLPALDFDRSLFHGQGLFDRFRCVKFDVSDALAFSTSLVSNDSDVSDFTALSLTEEIPNVFFFGFEGQAINQDCVVFSFGLFELLFWNEWKNYVLL